MLATRSRGSVPAALVFLTTLAAAQKVPDVRLDLGDPPGASESAPVAIASSGSWVYVAWGEARAGAAGVYANRSLDGGAHWLPTDVPLAPGRMRGLDPAIAADGGNVYVAWHDEADGDFDVYFNRSLDAGRTWLPAAVRLDVGDAPGSHASREAVIGVQGASVVVAWEDSRDPGGLSIYVNRSADRGTTWLPAARRVDLGPLGTGDSGSLDLAVSGTAFHLVWAEDYGSRVEILTNRSLDGGLSWMPSAVRIDRAPPDVRTAAPEIVALGGDLTATWFDFRSGPGLRSNRSTDDGASWGTSDVALPIGPAQVLYEEEATGAGALVHVAWSDYRPGVGHGIYHLRSADHGLTWSAETRLDPGGSGMAADLAIAAQGDLVQAVWTDPRTSGHSDVFTNRSTDGGATWLATEPRLDTGSTPGAASSYLPRVSLSGASSYVAWYDDRNGAFDVYFDLAFGYQAYGEGKAGSGGIVPSLAGKGGASLGTTAIVALADGVGGAPAVLLSTFAGPARLPTSLGTLLLQPPWKTSTVVLGGAAGAPGAGAASVSAPIPPDPGLVGVRVDLQAGVLDPGAAQGVSLSPGLELWIL